MMIDRIAEALGACAERLGWSNEKLAAEIGVSVQSVRNYRQRKSDPSVSVYGRMRDNIPGFADLIDSKDLDADTRPSRTVAAA